MIQTLSKNHFSWFVASVFSPLKLKVARCSNGITSTRYECSKEMATRTHFSPLLFIKTKKCFNHLHTHTHSVVHWIVTDSGGWYQPLPPSVRLLLNPSWPRPSRPLAPPSSVRIHLCCNAFHLSLVNAPPYPSVSVSVYSSSPFLSSLFLSLSLSLSLCFIIFLLLLLRVKYSSYQPSFECQPRVISIISHHQCMCVFLVVNYDQ